MLKTIFTIGFTQTSAKDFFQSLKNNNVIKLIDVRLNNSSQLSGFAKQEDLKYFLHEINDIEYLHLPELAPTKVMLDNYKKNNGDWNVYEEEYLNLMERRVVERIFSPDMFEKSCLLCSEKTPHNCHRRLVAEYLNDKWGMVFEVKHIV